jgi:FtsP/CotA-like multicopper oxidase with cupredoxin domain
MPFTDYRGNFVFHCHILDHEDGGMMSRVEVRRRAR